METIFLTDNKRLSTGYYADKTIFAQKVDVNHVLNTEVYQSRISRVRFWVIRSNIYNEESLVHQLCKTLVNRVSTAIKFEFSIDKIAIGQEPAYEDEKITIHQKERNSGNSKCSGYVAPTTIKNTSLSKSINFLKLVSFSKTISCFQWPHQNSRFAENRKITQKQVSFQKKEQEIITLKPLLKKDFEVSSLSQLSAIFMSKEGIFEEFGLREEAVMNSKRIVATYIFKQNDIEIGLSIVSEGCKKYIQKAIKIEITEAFNPKFDPNKQHSKESFRLTENFSASNVSKSITKSNHENQKQTHHKILLFLFTNHDSEGQKIKVSSSNLSQSKTNKQTSKFIKAIQEWKIKDEDINITEKISKEYVLIKQEIEDEKISFRNKLKIFEAIIGERINVEKLLNEEKDMQNSSSMVNAQKNINGQKMSDNARISRKSDIKATLNSPQQIIGSSTNSEFKRLKQSFEMIRNIDNIISEQNKKIEKLKLYRKKIVKSKNQLLYKNAKAKNQEKKEISEIKKEIEQIKIGDQFRSKKIEKQKNDNRRNFIPTGEAKELLDSRAAIFQKIQFNQKSNYKNEKQLTENEFLGGDKLTDKQNQQRLSHYNSVCRDQDPKKAFSIRKQSSSFIQKNNSSISFLQKYSNNSHVKMQPCKPTILSTLQKCEKQKQTKLVKKRRQQVEKNNIRLSFQRQDKESYYEQKDGEISNNYEKEVLVSLYEYFLKNNQLINEVNREMRSNRIPNNFSRNSINLESSNKSESQNQTNLRVAQTYQRIRTHQNDSASQLNLHNKHYTRQNKDFSAKKIKLKNESLLLTSQHIEVQNFPLLYDILNSSDCKYTTLQKVRI